MSQKEYVSGCGCGWISVGSTAQSAAFFNASNRSGYCLLLISITSLAILAIIRLVNDITKSVLTGKYAISVRAEYRNACSRKHLHKTY